MNPSVYSDALLACLMRLAQLRREPVDPLQLQSHLREASLDESCTPQQVIAMLAHTAQALGWQRPRSSTKADPGRLPCLVISPGQAPALITGQTASGRWSTLSWDAAARQMQEHEVLEHESGTRFIQLRMAVGLLKAGSPSLGLIWSEIWRHPRALLDMAAVSVTITTLALATSFYSMQVYDRVVPTRAESTLLVLTLGVIISILLEVLGKWLRSRQILTLTNQVDQSLARSVYGRFLNLRLDQLPLSVGATASRMRGYESIRAFLLTLLTQAMVDIPLALLTLLVLFFIGVLMHLSN